MKTYLSNLFSDFLLSFWKHYVLWSFIFITYFCALYAFLFYQIHGSLFYVDTDCYTRALRIVDWLQNFEWQEKIFPYSNYPDGFILHFTRINDVIWLILSLPFMTIFSLKDAVFYGGFFFSPFFLFLTIISLLWGIKPFLNSTKNNAKLFLAIFAISFTFCCKLSHTFDFYRPDHHSFMCFIFTFSLSALLRSYNKQNIKELFWAGILTGIGLWVSSAPEGLYVAFIFLLILCVDCIFRKQNTILPLFYSLGLFYATTAAWLINPPYGGYATLDNARLSVIHVLLTSLILLSFAILYFGHFKSKIKKTAILSISAVSSVLFMLCIFGSDKLFAQIYDEPVLKYFVPYINEMKGMLAINVFLLPTIIIGIFIFALLPFKNSYSLSMFLLYCMTAPLSVAVVRFYQYYLVVWLFLYSFGLILLFNNKDADDKHKLLAFIYLVWPIFYLTAFDYNPVKLYIPQVHGVILTDTFRGPELIWERNANTVSSPYHTNVKGIQDNHIMWFTSDENQLKEFLRKRKVKYIHLPEMVNSEYYVNPEDNLDKLYGKVITGKNIYPWMTKTDERTYLVNYNKF